MTDIAVAIGTISVAEKIGRAKSETSRSSLSSRCRRRRRRRPGLSSVTAAELYANHQRKYISINGTLPPSPFPRIHSASSFYFCVSRFYGLFPEMTHFAFSWRRKMPPQKTTATRRRRRRRTPLSFYFIFVLALLLLHQRFSRPTSSTVTPFFVYFC